MSKLALTAMVFGTILAVIPSDATAQKPGSKPSTRAQPAQPAAEWRKKKAVARNPSPFMKSANAAVLKDLGAKVDLSMSAKQNGASWYFWAQFQGKGKAPRPEMSIHFKCKVKTEPSNPPGVWLDHPCQPLGAYFPSSSDPAGSGFSVPVPEPAPFQQGFLKLTGFQVVATIDPSTQVPEWDEENNTASLTWE